jgi:hypothetical protein
MSFATIKGKDTHTHAFEHCGIVELLCHRKLFASIAQT